MPGTILFRDEQLASALGALQGLRSASTKRSGSSRLIVNGIGDTANAVNNAYAALRQIDSTLDELIRVTVDALKAAGYLFPEADASSAEKFSAIDALRKGGFR